MVNLSAAAAGLAFEVGKRGTKSAKEISLNLFNYDFVGLMVKLVIFYTVAYLIAKFMEAVTGGSNFLVSVAAFFGLKLPTVFPEKVMDFFQFGINGIKFWDIVKMISIFLVVMEAMNYIRAEEQFNRKPSPMTLGLFVLIAGGLSLITFPELIQRIKEGQVMFRTVAEATFDPDNPDRTFRGAR